MSSQILCKNIMKVYYVLKAYTNLLYHSPGSSGVGDINAVIEGMFHDIIL